MGLIPGKLKDAWRRLNAEAHAVENLQAAIAAHDTGAALQAIAQARPGYIPREDGVLHLIGNYSQSPGHDPELLRLMREAVYQHFDPKISAAPWREGRDDNERNASRARTGFENRHYAYAFALYMNDAKTMRKLNKSWVMPDDVAQKVGRVSLVMAAIRRGNLDALVETIRHGASITRGWGLDEYARPLEMFASPRFIAEHQDAVKALMKTGDAHILAAIDKGLKKIERRKGRFFSLN